MPSYEFVTVDVFTAKRFGGNPLAVFPEAEGLDSATMQALAREFNYSEITFVLPPQDARHTARVRIFTPAAELPFAGHPNVGTGFVLAGRATTPLPDHYVFEEDAGLVRVRVLCGENGKPNGARIAAPQALSLGDAVPSAQIAACVGLKPEDIRASTHPPLVASVGTPFVIAEVASPEALARAVPDAATFRRVAATVRGAVREHFSLQLYTRLEGEARRLRTRVFCPLLGIVEDPATGSANATLAALLTSFAPGEQVELDYEIEQGVEMGRPSRLLASATKSADGPVLARVAGDCVTVMRGRVEV